MQLVARQPMVRPLAKAAPAAATKLARAAANSLQQQETAVGQVAAVLVRVQAAAVVDKAQQIRHRQQQCHQQLPRGLMMSLMMTTTTSQSTAVATVGVGPGTAGRVIAAAAAAALAYA
jgi:hypothetical protein